jgi:tetratricopeptide (TPR) repeat protein
MGMTNTPPARRSYTSLDLGIFLVALTFLMYMPAICGGFIWDDVALITENRVIRAEDGLHRLWLTTQADDYYPLTGSLWWLEWRLWGKSATGYHVVNVLLHGANAVLVWLILTRLKVPGAWVAGCVFALHPVNVATAAWISEQKNTLSMLFFAVAILSYLRFYDQGRWRWYACSLGAFLLAELSKAAVVMLPVVLLGCVWWTRRRILWKDVLWSAPFFVLSLVWGLVTLWYQYHLALGEPVAGTDGFGFRLAVAGCAPWFYLYKALVPFHLIAVYPRWQIDSSRWVSYLPGALLVMGFLVLWWKRRTWGRPLLFGLGYFVVMLFPVLGLLKQGPYRLSVMADRWDHWQYYSTVGVIALAVAAGEAVCRRMAHRWPQGRTVAAVTALLVLAAATWQRAGVYAAEETLWRDTIAKNPRATAAYLNLGQALIKRGKTGEAIRCYEEALRIDPNFVEGHSNLGIALVQQGRLAEAVGHYEEALRINPAFAEAHNNLGTAFLRLGKLPEAIQQLEQALRLKPNYVDAHNNLGTALARAGRIPEAIAHWEQALRLRPDFAEAHNNLGSALAGNGQIQDAIAHYQEALRLKPDYADAHNNFGNALLQEGKLLEAVEQYQRALALNPNLTAARNSLARLQSGQ